MFRQFNNKYIHLKKLSRTRSNRKLITLNNVTQNNQRLGTAPTNLYFFGIAITREFGKN